MGKVFHRKPSRASRAGLTHISQILASIDWLEDLRREALAEAERRGAIRGPVTRPQRPWSHAIDRIESARQEAGSA